MTYDRCACGLVYRVPEAWSAFRCGACLLLLRRRKDGVLCVGAMPAVKMKRR